MVKDPEEWLRQADYDIETAEFMLNGGRYFYAVFMCHLSIEKALKGLYQKRLQKIPPKIHNLIYFLNKVGIKPEESIGKFIVKLNEASVVTRYPEELSKLQRDFTQEVVKNIIKNSREVLQWIKKLY
ncbi:MAG: HEPN domain-containing protein [Thermodesulfobacteriota bacterium]